MFGESLHSSVHSFIPNSQKKRLRKDLRAIKEGLDVGDIDSFNWIPTHLQLGDPLTKSMDARVLVEAIVEGVITTIGQKLKKN